MADVFISYSRTDKDFPQLALANVPLNETREASQVVQQGLAILAELEKSGPLPPSRMETLKVLKQLEQALLRRRR
jgi:hypothetical protein